MALARDLNIKPSCVQELNALPAAMLPQVLEKIGYLVNDPLPDGRLKKKLVGWQNVFRLRIGDFRLLYSFGSNWIRVLAIRPRREVYRRQIEGEVPTAIGRDSDVDADLDSDEDLAPGASVTTWPAAEARELPGSLSDAWLSTLNVPREFHAVLMACRTEDDLLSASVPLNWLERVVENLFPRPVEEVILQPDLVVFDPEDLARYREGDLLGFLLRLDPDQERLVDWALKGPALIRGGPGTGKSTIALYRVRSLLDHAKRTGKGAVRVLFTTYTPALTRFSEQLLRQLLPDRMDQVRVETADGLALRIVKAHERVERVLNREELEARARKHSASLEPQLARSLARFRVEYLLDELEWVIEGRDLKSLGEYLAADRAGRGIALSENARRAIWSFHEGFQERLKRAGVHSLSCVRCRALELVRAGNWNERYEAVMIDEAQDLTPTALSLLVELASDPTGIYLTADASQSIYYRGFAWQSVHERLRFRGRAVNLRRNYRSTREIAAAAGDFIRRTGSGDVETPMLQSSVVGPLPVLFPYDNDSEAWARSADFIRRMSRHLRLRPSAAAVLVPSTSIGEQAAAALTELGLPARFTPGPQLDLEADHIKVMTLATAKGLEFPYVVIAGLADAVFPRIPEELDPEELEQELRHARRVLFVGMTRAMRGLLLLYSRSLPTRFIEELSPSFWQMSDS